MAAAISANAPNSPKIALRKTCGRPVNRSGSAMPNPITRFATYGNRSGRRERARERFDQTPGRQDSDGAADHQHRGRPEQCASAHLGPELPIAQHQHDGRQDVEGESEVLAEGFGRRVAACGDVGGVDARRHDHDAQQHHPGDAFARGQRRGQQGQHERPRKAGVGEVEQVAVDEFARRLDELPDQRRHAGQQRHGRDDADCPAGDGGQPAGTGRTPGAPS